MKKNSRTEKTVKTRNIGVILGFLNFLNDFFVKKLTGGFFARLLSGTENSSLENNSYTFGRSSDNPEGGSRSLRRYILRAYDNSVAVSAVKRALNFLQSCCLNVYGSFLLSFGIYSLVVFFIKYYVLNENHLDRYLFSEAAFLGSVIIIFIAIPFMASNKTVSALVSDSVILRGFLEHSLGVPREKFEYRVKRSRPTAYFIAIIFGIVLAGVSYFIQPAVIALILLGIIAISVVMIFPEIGVLVSIFCAPFLGMIGNPTYLLVMMVTVTFISYAIKVATGKRTFRFKMTDFLVSVFTLLMIFGGIITSGGDESLDSAMAYASLLLIYFLVVNLMNTREWLDKCVFAIAIPSALTALYGLIGYSSVIMPGGWIDSNMFGGITSRAVSTFSNPNILATYLVMTAPFIWIYFKDRDIARSGKLLSFICSVISAACVVLTWSRGGWLGFLAALTVYLFINYRYTFKYILIAGAVAPIGLIFAPGNITDRLLSIGNLGDSSTYYRLFTWKGSINMMIDHLIGGIGVGESAFNQIYPIYSYLGTEATAHSHNLFLQIGIELGVVGLIVFLAVMISAARRGFGSLRTVSCARSRLIISAGIAGIAAALVHGLVDYIWYNYRVFFVFWVVIAVLCACSKVEGAISEYGESKDSDGTVNEATLNILFK